MGLVSGRVQKVMKAGLLVPEVLGQQRQASAGDAGQRHLFAAGDSDNWTPRAKLLGAILDIGLVQEASSPGIDFQSV